MGIVETKRDPLFPYRGEPTTGSTSPNRFANMPTPADMRKRSLFGIPLKSQFTGELVEDATLQFYIDAAISELEHTLDLYISPILFDERHDYSRHSQLWSFGYLKVDHSPVNTVKKFELTFNNGMAQTPPLVDIPLEFIHTQPLEGTIQMVPAQGVTISGLVISIYSGLGYHALNSQAITSWPGAVHVIYEAGFQNDKVPALLASLIENLAAIKFLSTLGPVIFPHNSVSIGIDGTSQSVSTMGPGFFQNRMKELQEIVDKQIDTAKGYYNKRFISDTL